MPNPLKPVDVLCLGHASYDLVFSVPRHPGPDEKTTADNLLGCGGGPAANAAVQVGKLGFSAGFCGYLGNDVYGESHLRELRELHVDTGLLARGDSPTPLSAVLVKPDGKRTLINYKGRTAALAADAVDFSGASAKVVLFDGHEPRISLKLLETFRDRPVPSVLDAGSQHDGVMALLDKVDYLACSEKFAVQYAGSEEAALSELAKLSPVVIITLGERGLVWKRGAEQGALPAPPITAIDTTGAGDAFHGALAAAIAAGMPWLEMLRFASAAGGLCCTQMGARPGLPDLAQVNSLLESWTDG